MGETLVYDGFHYDFPIRQLSQGVSRHPKSGKNKGGMKEYTVMKYQMGVLMVLQLTSAAKHDRYLLKEIHLPKDATLAMARAYVDYAHFQRLRRAYAM